VLWIEPSFFALAKIKMIRVAQTKKRKQPQAIFFSWSSGNREL
jgi:hypothetical protein